MSRNDLSFKCIENQSDRASQRNYERRADCCNRKTQTLQERRKIMRIEQASQIAVDCIVETVNFSDPIRGEDTLAFLGVRDRRRINGLRNRIVTDEDIGVPSVGHRLDPVFLEGLSGDWTVVQLILVVFNNSVIANRRPAHERAVMALQKVQNRRLE